MLLKKKIRQWTKFQKRRLCQLTSHMLCSLFWSYWPLKIRAIGFTKIPVRNYHSVVEISQDDLATQALVWLLMVWFRAVLLWFIHEFMTTSHFSAKFKERNLVLHSSKYSICFVICPLQHMCLAYTKRLFRDCFLLVTIYHVLNNF